MNQDNIVRDLVIKIEPDLIKNIEDNEKTSMIKEEFQFIAKESTLDDASSTAESDYEIISDSEARNNDAFFSKRNKNFRSPSVSDCEKDNKGVIAERRICENTRNVTQNLHSSQLVPFQLTGGGDNELNFVPCTNLGVTKEVLVEKRRFRTHVPSPVQRKVIFQSNNIPIRESVNAPSVKPTIKQEKFNNEICDAKVLQRKVDFHSMNASESKFSSCASQKLNQEVNTTTVHPNSLQRKVCQSTSDTNNDLNIFEPCILSKIIREMLNEEVSVGVECENSSLVSSSSSKTYNNVTIVPANVPDATMTNQEKLEVNKPTERMHVVNIQQRVSTNSLNPETRTNQSARTGHISVNPNQPRKRPSVRVEGVSFAQGSAVSSSRSELDHESAAVSCSEVTSKHAKLGDKTNVESRSASSIQQETVFLSSNKFDHLLASYAPLKFTEPQKMQRAVYEQRHSVDGSAVCRMEDFSARDSFSKSSSILQRGKSKNAPAAPKKRILWTHKNPSVQDNQIDPIEMQIAVLCEPNTKLEIASLPLETFGQKSVLVLIPDDVIPVISESDNVIPVITEEVNGGPIVTENVGTTPLTAGNSCVVPNGAGNACKIPVVMDNHGEVSVVMDNGNILPATAENENVIFVGTDNRNMLPIDTGVESTVSVAGNNRMNVAPLATENDSVTAVVGENGDVIPVVMEDYSLATAKDHNLSPLTEGNNVVFVVTDNSSNVPVIENNHAAPVTVENGSIVPVAMENSIITLAGPKNDSLSTSTEYNDQSVVTSTKSIKSGQSKSHSMYELSTCSRCSDKFLNQPEPKKFRVRRTDEPPNTCKSCCARIKRANYLNSHMMKITNRRQN